MLYNGLHIQSTAYNAATNTPDITQANDYSAAIYQVTTAGYQAGITVTGATVTGGGSYLMLGDMVVAINGTYQLLSNAIVTGGQTISVGATPFTTLAKANAYLNQRTYTNVTLQLTANTVETASVDVQNLCGGTLTIDGNGKIADFSGTASTNLIISGSNVTLNNFSVKADYVSGGTLLILGCCYHQNGLTINNIGASGYGVIISGGSLTTQNVNADGSPNSASDIWTLTTPATGYTYFPTNGQGTAYGVSSSGGVFYFGLASNTFIGNGTVSAAALGGGGGSLFRCNGNTTCTRFSAGSACVVNFGGTLNVTSATVDAFNAGSVSNIMFNGTVTCSTAANTMFFGNACQMFFAGGATVGKYTGGSAATAVFVGGTGSIIGLPASSISGLQY